jgi:spore maturation protein CgeB
VNSSWGNGHATLWRGLCRALAALSHEVVFFEKDTPYYAAHRDLTELPGAELVLYSTWEEVLNRAKKELASADKGMVTSYCPDALAASELVLSQNRCLRVFYDLDTPITLASLHTGKPAAYIGERGLNDFDLVLSYTGGEALSALQNELGARRVAPLYGSVDPEVHRPAGVKDCYLCELSYLGTYAADRQAALEALFIEPARRIPDKGFLIGGAQYPQGFPWTTNIRFVWHVPPAEHSAFYCSSRLTLNVTREAMARMGYCPSGRLFEAAACGVPILSDWWAGLDRFFTPGKHILVAKDTEEAIRHLELPDEQLRELARAAREHVLTHHTALVRAHELVEVLEHPPEGIQHKPEQTLVEQS